MRRGKRILGMLLGIALLVFSAPANVRAAEVPAAITADQLIAASGAQLAAVTSSHATLTESVQMTDTNTGLSSTLNLTMDVQQSRTVQHAALTMQMGILGMEMTIGHEEYAVLDGGVMTSYLSDGSGAWRKFVQPAPAGNVNLMTGFYSGLDTTGAVVSTDGTLYRFQGSVARSALDSALGSAAQTGIAVDAASFPVIVEIDAATLLPMRMIIGMNGMAASGAPTMTVTATAVITVDSYNQLDALAVPAAVMAAAR